LPLLLTHWALTPQMAGSIASTSLAAAAIGGIGGGWLSDRLGRLRLLQGAILLAALATAACALAQSPAQLLAARGVQGLGFGAEWAVGAVLLGEHVRDEHRGHDLGVMQSAWAVGWAGAVAVFLLATMLLPPALAWRGMFLAGLLPALLVLWLRRKASAYDAPLGTAGRLEAVLFKRLALAGLIGLGAHGGYHSLFTWLPTLLRRDAGYSHTSVAIILFLMTAGFAIGCVVAGRLADRRGRRISIAVFATLSIAAALAITMGLATSTYGALLAAPIGFAAGGTPAVLGTWFTELFPPAIRGAGVGFAYNAGRVASALIPGAIGWSSGAAALALLVGIAAATSYCLILIVLPLLPETRGRPLAGVHA
jgi:MFS family permease